jgi:hypothetical protein
MNGFFDKLNLRPAERRVLVAVLLALFAVVNLLWVWPRFGDWKKAQNRFQEIETKMANYQKLIRLKATLDGRLQEFETESQGVPAEEQVTTFISTFNSLANQCGVLIRGTARTSVRTNENFVEYTQRIPVLGDESALVNYLFRLGDSNSAVPIRVKELSLHPVPPQRQKLEGDVTLVASFQRKLNIRAPVPAARTATGSAAGASTVVRSNAPAAKAPSIPPVTTNRLPTRSKS